MKDKRYYFRKLFVSGIQNSFDISRKIGCPVYTIAEWISEDFPEPKTRKKPQELFNRKNRPPLGERKIEEYEKSRKRNKELAKKQDQFKRLYLSRKFSLKEIREKIGIAHGTIHKWKKEFFPEGASWRKNRFTVLYEKGIHPYEIAAMIKCSDNYVFRLIQEYNKENALLPT
jgi:uncharacterized protein YjcR